MSEYNYNNQYNNNSSEQNTNGSSSEPNNGWQNVNDYGYGTSGYNSATSYSNNYNSGRRPKKRGSHPVLLVAVCAIIAIAAGFGGAYAGLKMFSDQPSAAIVTQSATTSGGSQTTDVSYDSNTGLTITEAAAKAAPSVVEIVVTTTVESSNGFFGSTTYEAEAAGSGVIITSDGYIITNNHVVEDSTAITVTTYDGDEYSAVLVGTDEKSDIAVVKIEAEKELTAATIGDSSLIQAGDTAVVIGNPLGTLGGSVTSGIISATSREVIIDNESMELIQTDATVNSGNSGGGLFDGNGNLIGIINAKYSGTTSSGTIIEGIGYAIPINYAMEIAEELCTYGEVTNRATIGVYIQVLSQDTENYVAGVYIVDVMSGGGAEAAGLQAYDRIVNVAGTDISSYADITKILRSYSPGDVIEITVERDGRELTVSLTLTGVLESE